MVLTTLVQDRDQAMTDQSHIPTVQASQEKSPKAQGLTQMINSMLVAQAVFKPVQQSGFVSLIIQA